MILCWGRFFGICSFILGKGFVGLIVVGSEVVGNGCCCDYGGCCLGIGVVGWDIRYGGGRGFVGGWCWVLGIIVIWGVGYYFWWVYFGWSGCLYLGKFGGWVSKGSF